MKHFLQLITNTINVRAILFAFLMNLTLIPIHAQIAEKFIVTNEIMSDKPISPLLYSNFIELGYGIQVEPMWGEMLWNRSFIIVTFRSGLTHQIPEG